jgi:hypothetical protein
MTASEPNIGSHAERSRVGDDAYAVDADAIVFATGIDAMRQRCRGSISATGIPAIGVLGAATTPARAVIARYFGERKFL